MRKALLLALCAGVLVAAASPAMAVTYPPNRTPTCNVSDHTPSPGESVQFGGKFWGGPAVKAGFHQKNTGTKDVALIHVVSVGPPGTWSTTFNLPNGLHNGDAAFGAQGHDKGGNFFQCVIHVTITGASLASSSSPLPVTTGMLSVLVLGAFGTAMIVRSRRRTRRLVA